VILQKLNSVLAHPAIYLDSVPTSLLRVFIAKLHYSVFNTAVPKQLTRLLRIGFGAHGYQTIKHNITSLKSFPAFILCKSKNVASQQNIFSKSQVRKTELLGCLSENERACEL
jgi:hypothetical protein